MKTTITTISWVALVLGLLTLATYGCAVTGGIAGPGYEADIGVGYYDPYGPYYGHWGPGYHVAPYRGGAYRGDRGPGRQAPHAYRAAAPNRQPPSLPTRQRARDDQRPH
jgi:hypothetical protein